MQEVIIRPPERAELEQANASLLAKCRAFQRISSLEDHAQCLDLLKLNRAGQKVVRDRLDPLCAQANALHKSLTKLRADFLAPLQVEDARHQRLLDGWEEEQRRLAEEARREAEALARKEEEERQFMAACEAEDRGDTATANAILEQEVTVPVIHVPPALAKVEGVSGRKLWRFELLDKASVLLWCLEHNRLDLVELDEAGLNKFIQGAAGQVQIPGLRPYQVTSRSVRTA